MHISPERCGELAQLMLAGGIKLEWEGFSPTHIVQEVSRLIRGGLDKPPYFINIVLGTDRAFQNAMPYLPKILDAMVDLLPSDSMFCVTGIEPAQLPYVANALLLGGHRSVSLEEICIFRTDGRRPTWSSRAARSQSSRRWGLSWRRPPRRGR
jgi:uncharacterized protein (DUF849 family)